MAKKLQFNEEARKSLMSGVEKISKSVLTTLGPKGRLVLIERSYGAPEITKDGVTVAKNVELEDRFENMGAQLVREVASKTNDVAGDGTTTATCLAWAITREGMKSVSVGVNPMGLKRGIDKATADAIELIKQKSKTVEGQEEIAQVAAISANNDPEIGKLIADAIDKVGVNGVLSCRDSKTTETFVDFVEGMQFPRGYISPYFCNDKENMTVSYEEPYILLYDKVISSTNSILPILEATTKAGKPLIIIADNIEGEALTTLVVNSLRGLIQVCAVKAPGFGSRKKEMLEDIAVLTGGKLVDEALDMKLETMDPSWLGIAKNITITRDSTTIVGGNGTQEGVQERVDSIKREIADASSEFEKEKLQERLAKLAGGVAEINVGAIDETSLKEKKYRIEDSISATRAAIEEGVVPGGGVTLCQIAEELSEKDLTILPEDERAGYKIVVRALEEPIRQIAENAGVDGSIIAANCKKAEPGVGYDAYNDEWVPMLDKGILDPAKVTRSALQNASSIAGLLLTTECTIVQIPEKNEAPMPM